MIHSRPSALVVLVAVFSACSAADAPAPEPTQTSPSSPSPGPSTEPDAIASVAAPPPERPYGDPVEALQSFQHCAPNGFCWRAPSLLTGNDLRKVWGTSPHDIWLAGREILHWDGYEWASRGNLPPTNCVSADAPVADSFAGTGLNDVWMSAGTSIYHWNGSAWSLVETHQPCMNPDGSLAPKFGRLFALGPNDVWAGGTQGVAYHWDGKRWNDVHPTGLTSGVDGSPVMMSFAQIWGSATNDVWFAGGDSQLVHWDGKRFTSQPPVGIGSQWFQAIWGSSKNDVWAAGTNGTIVHNDGTGFHPVASPTTRDLITATGLGPNDALFTGQFTSASAPALHWNGTTFVDENIPSILGTWAESASRIWAVGEDGRVWIRDSKGWSRILGTEQPKSWRAVWGTNPNDLWVAGSGVNHWDGKKFTNATNNMTAFAVDGQSQSNVWAVGAVGSTEHFNGASWTSTYVGASVWLRGVRALAGGGAIAVGDGGVIFKHDGAAWTPMTSPTKEDLYGVWGPSDDVLYAVGEHGTILELRDGVWTLQASPVVSRLTRVHGAPDGTILAVGSMIASDSNPNQLVAGCVLRLVDGAWTRQSNTPYEDLTSIQVRSAGLAWATAGHGLLYRWDGATWTRFDSTTMDTVLDVRMTADNQVSIVTSGGGLLQRLK